MKLTTADVQKETKSTFEKIADFSRKIRKDDVIDDDDDDDDDDDIDDVDDENVAAGSILPTPKRKLRKLFEPITEDDDIEEIILEPISIHRTPGDKKVTYPDIVTKLFPDANDQKSDSQDDHDSISEVQKAVSELNNGNLPYDLQFFSGGWKMKKKKYLTLSLKMLA